MNTKVRDTVGRVLFAFSRERSLGRRAFRVDRRVSGDSKSPAAYDPEEVYPNTPPDGYLLTVAIMGDRMPNSVLDYPTGNIDCKYALLVGFVLCLE